MQVMLPAWCEIIFVANLDDYSVYTHVIGQPPGKG